MSKFRKKPIVIEAEQWFIDIEIEGVKREIRYVLGFPTEHFYIDTLEGKMDVKPSDWIITGINGEKYPCKPDIFEKTYDAVMEVHV